MKLLSPKEVNKSSQELRSKQAREGLEIASLLKRGKTKLRQLEDSYNRNKELFDKDLLDFSKEISNQKRVLEAEVNKLEQRKKQALEPLTKQELMLDTKIEKLNDLDTILDEKQASIDKDIEELDTKTIYLEDLQNYLNGLKKTLDKREEEINATDTQAKKEMLKFWATRKTWNELKEKEENELKDKTIDYNIKLDALNKREQRLNQIEKDIEKDRNHLYSQQKALKLAFTEAKKKGIKI